MAKNIRERDALIYHELPRPGKIEVTPTKPTNTQRDLALAYSPGVAEPCKKIAEEESEVYRYTSKGNLVAVISNGTAVLGLGDIGPSASKPVMEGKGVLFKVFADIDVFDLELNTTNVDEFVRTVKILEPTFGGVNLEDIAAPECFEIETRLKKELNIPVMHDDQHGTAIITAAAMINALEIANKNIDNVTTVVSGAGASAISCTRLLIALGMKPENIFMLDSKGVITTSRSNLNALKKEFARDTDKNTLQEALKGADVFLGLSRGNILQPEDLLGMNSNPIVFAMANPDPEIAYELAIETRDDVIMATGRSDHPNQVNNVLGFPFIFRGALDVRATEINEEMKLAAVMAIAELAKKPVPDLVKMAYKHKDMMFGKHYIIPKPLDPRLITTVAPAVAKAAMKSGTAQLPIANWQLYEQELMQRMGLDNQLMRVVMNRARRDPKRLVFPEGDNLNILQAAQVLHDDGIADITLLGNEVKIRRLMAEHGIDLPDVKIINPLEHPQQREAYGKMLFEKRQRKGYTLNEAERKMKIRDFFGLAMVEMGHADCIVTGQTKKYSEVLSSALQIIGPRKGINRVSGMYIILTKKGILFLGDPTVNVNPDSETIVKIAELMANAVKRFNIEPRIAMLSYSNFGSSATSSTTKMAQAVKILQEKYPDLLVDGEMQANFALNKDLINSHFPFSTLSNKKVNTLIFPNLSAGNISYKLLQELGGVEAIGPLLLGMKKSVHILQMGCSVREIVNVAAISVMDAQIIENEY